MLPIVQSPIPEDVIDLGAGEPAQSAFPLDMIFRAAQDRLTQSDRSFLQYGAEQGDGYFRLALAQFLSRHYSSPVNHENILITSGISSALDLLCTLFTKSGDTIFVEENTFFVAPKIFSDHHLNIIPIAMDENGLVIESLEDGLKTHRSKFLYTIPIHHNPTGSTLIEPRRARLLELAQQFDFLILADEVYQLLTYTENPPKPFGGYVENDHVISLGSFSKIVAPGLRLGWIQTHEKIIQRVIASGQLDSGGGMNPFTSAILRGMIEAGDLDQHLGRLKQLYGSQLSAMVEVLSLHLPEVHFQIPKGGYFIWLQFPDHIDVSELRAMAKSQHVDLRQGILFSLRGESRNFARLCFAHYDEKQIREGVLRLSTCLR